MVQASDFLICLAAIFLSFSIYVSDIPGIRTERYFVAGMIGIIIQQNGLYFSGIYRLDLILSSKAQISRLVVVWCCVFIILIFGAFFAKISDEYSRVWVLIWFIFGFAGMFTSRLALRYFVRGWIREGRLVKNVVIVGAGERGARMIEHIVSGPGYLRLIGVFDDRSDRVPSEVSGLPVIGRVDDVAEYARRNRVDLILVALPWTAKERIQKLLTQLQAVPADIRLVPEAPGQNITSGGYSEVAGVPVLNLLDKPLKDGEMLAKMVEDYFVALLLLFVTAPFMLLISILIKLESSGPIIFKQRRYGFNNRLIEIYKFRTMFHDQTDELAESLTERGDPRVTCIGRLLRVSSLDELPQLFNVISGDMSIVGPRPHPISAKAGKVFYEDLVDQYASRHRIKPGITGWAQVNGWRGNTDTENKLIKRVELDLYYIENWSILLDFKIIFATLFEIIRARNAY